MNRHRAHAATGLDTPDVQLKNPADMKKPGFRGFQRDWRGISEILKKLARPLQ